MEMKLLSPLWGHEHVEQNVFLEKIRLAGYDGIDTWLPDDVRLKQELFDYLQKHEMVIVTHQHQATGRTFEEFKSSFLKNLTICAEPNPISINSHTGRDYFSLEQHLELIDIAQEFSEKSGIMVTHETHRGRLGYCPQMIEQIFSARPDFLITADFSHWVCVTESFLENFSETLNEAIARTKHVHARIGYEQGPQVADPRAPEWKYALDNFLLWWDRIVQVNVNKGVDILPFTTEFGPPPYLQTEPFSQRPLADQFQINCYMKDLLKRRYPHSC
ncbi:MAG: sugar phosphate isomerase/epimerase [Sphingobacterium sp.]